MNDLSRLTTQVLIAKDLDDLSVQTQSMITNSGLVCFLFSIENNFLSFISSADPRESASESALKGLRLPAPDVLLQKTTIDPTFFPDLKAASAFSDILTFLDRRGCQSAVVTCLVGENKPMFVVFAGSRDNKPLENEDIIPLNNYNTAASKALDRILLMGSLEHQKKTLEFNKSLSNLIAEEDDLHTFCSKMHLFVKTYFESETGFSISLISPFNNLIAFPYHADKNEESVRHAIALGDDLTSHIIKSQKVVTWNNQGPLALQKLGIVERTTLPNSYLGIPMKTEKKTIGVFAIQDSEKAERFEPTDIDFFISIAPMIASAINNLQEKGEVSDATKNYQVQKSMVDLIFSHAPFVVYFKDQTGKYIRANQALIRQFALNTENDILGKSDLNLLSEEEGVLSYKDDLEIISTGASKLGIKGQRRLTDGSVTYYTLNKIPITNETGVTTGILGVSWDDTELRKVQNSAEEKQSQIDTITELSRIASSSADLTAILDQSVNLIQQKFNLYHAAVYMIDPLHEFANYRMGTGDVGKKHMEDGYHISLKGTAFGEVYATRESRFVPDITQDKTYFQDPLLPDAKSALTIPLRTGNDVLGILDFEKNTDSGFQPQEIELLKVIADQLAVAVSNASQSGKLQDYLLRQRSLYLITSNATAAPDVSQALQVVVDGLFTALPKAQIMLFQPDKTGTMSITAQKGYENLDVSQIKVAPGEGIVGEAAVTKKVIRIEDTTADQRFIPIDKDVRSEICIPISYRDDLLGVLNIESKEIRAFDENDAEILSTLGNTLGSIIANVRLVSQIRTQVQRQTQLYDITNKIRRAVDIQSILQVSTAELSNALNARKASIQIQPSTISQSGQEVNPEKGERS